MICPEASRKAHSALQVENHAWIDIKIIKFRLKNNNQVY
jgi:hypothetical protein